MESGKKRKGEESSLSLGEEGEEGEEEEGRVGDGEGCLRNFSFSFSF